MAGKPPSQASWWNPCLTAAVKTLICCAMPCCAVYAVPNPRESPGDRLSVVANGREASKGSQLVEAMTDCCNT